MIDIIFKIVGGIFIVYFCLLAVAEYHNAQNENENDY